METIELARGAAALGQTGNARQIYALVLRENRNPAEMMEAALWLLNDGADYRAPYAAFVRLFNAGNYRGEILDLMTRAFYEPNAKAIRKRYRANCRLLEKYPYLFRRNFIPFEELPVVFFPYDDSGYVPFDTREERFGEYVNVEIPVISRNFFSDLEKPIFAENVFSQYELEYLRDNVRPSEYVGRENHVYLYYPDWPLFCSWLQILDLRPLLENQKFVFLTEGERDLYPINFAERFGIDYSRCPVRPVGIREVNRLILHTQLSSHNGGDFFNEVFDAHPNLIAIPSLSMDDVTKQIAMLRDFLSQEDTSMPDWLPGSEWIRQLREIPSPTDKDLLVTLFLAERDWMKFVDSGARIAPALFFQPHFGNVMFSIDVFQGENAVLRSDELETLRHFRPFQEFRYIKTFTPLRRFTTSYAASVRYMNLHFPVDREGKSVLFYDAITQCVLNRSFMRDPGDRLFRDAVIVRFEDGKLNPKATFTRLAAFLDLPYTESMTYCSAQGVRDPVTPGNAVGFDASRLSWVYQEFANENERAYIEYFLRDAYAFYGYAFNYYDGAPVDESRAAEWVKGFDTLNGFMRERWEHAMERNEPERGGETASDEEAARIRKETVESWMREVQEQRFLNTSVLLRNLRFVNNRGTPLEMIPLLEPDPDLLEAPLYH